MDQEQLPPDPGRSEEPSGAPPGPGDWRPLRLAGDWMTEDDWQARLAALESEDEPDDLDPDLDLYLDPDHGVPPGTDGSLTPQEVAGARQINAAGFADGAPLDAAPGCAALAGFADAAAGDDDAYLGVCDNELTGVIRAWGRVEAHAAARRHAALAELIRRSPADGCAPKGKARLPEHWDEFTVDELAFALAESGRAAEAMLDLARDLEIKLPGTRAAFLRGDLRASKVAIIARACALLDPDEAREAEKLVLGRADRLTPGGLRAAITRAVMQVAPDKARKRREAGAKDARVERWAEYSGNAALGGRELPPDEVLAADQRITAWAKELKRAGLEGDTDELRARAFLDIMLGKDSRPGDHGSPAGGPWPYVGWVNLIVPLTTLLDLADRPGEIPGIGPVDPWRARDVARTAARNRKTTWCVTVTDDQGHAIGHGCAKSQSRSTMIIKLEPVATEDCDHRHETAGHDPGVMLRHLTQIRHARCTAPTCRRPATQCDLDHHLPHESGGRTCMCNCGPKCRHHHRLKQDPRWKVEQMTPATLRWTAPSGRAYTTEPTRYPT